MSSPVAPAAISGPSTASRETDCTEPGGMLISPRPSGWKVLSGLITRTWTRVSSSPPLAMVSRREPGPVGRPSSTPVATGRPCGVSQSEEEGPVPSASTVSSTELTRRPRDTTTWTASSVRRGMMRARSSGMLLRPGTRIPRTAGTSSGPLGARIVRSAMAGPGSGLTSSITDACAGRAPTPGNHASGSGGPHAVAAPSPRRAASSPGAASSSPVTTAASET